MLKPSKKKSLSVKFKIINALSGNEFEHVFNLKEGATEDDLRSENKYKQIVTSFRKRTENGDRIFYAKENYGVFDKQDIYNSAAKSLTKANKAVIEKIRESGENLAKSQVSSIEAAKNEVNNVKTK